MDELPELDVAPYSRLPPLDAATTVALIDRLEALAPARPAAALKSSLAAVRAAGTELRRAFDAARIVDPGLSKRPVDLDSDTAWWCIDARLETAAALPTRLLPRAERARELRARLFPEGRRFLTLEYSAQWAEMDSRMRTIERDKLRPELEALCGAPFVQFLFETHEKYRAMIGARPGAAAAAVKGSQAALSAPLARARRAVAGHYLQLLAAYQLGTTRLKAQLLPAFQLLDELRDKALAGAAPDKDGKDDKGGKDGKGDKGDKGDKGAPKDPGSPGGPADKPAKPPAP